MAFVFVLAALFQLPAPAGVVVTQNVSPGATSWPGSPVIKSVTNPAAQTAVGESFNATGGCTNYSETFTIPATNFVLQTISLYAGGGTGTTAGTNVTLRLFDLGNQTAPNPSPYNPGADLFNAGNGLVISYSPQSTGVLQFDFNGGDQVTLTNGHMYAFEMDGVLNSSPLLWERTTNDSYSGGAAYRNRAWINGNNARDFALAVYASAMAGTSTNSPWVPVGIVFHAFPASANGVNQDGANPAAGLALSGGVLCGTTLNGGSQGAGTAFYMTPDGSNFVAFRSFANAPDAGNPQGGLAISGGGFFGTSSGGGGNSTGTVFAGQTNGGVSLLRSFAVVQADTATNSGGASPGGMIALSGGALYGTTAAGGAAANGTVFMLTTNGSTFSDLHDFSDLNSVTGTNADGVAPWGGLILSGGILYGTASSGGAGGSGVVFSINTNSGSFTALHSFAPMDTISATNADGAMPYGGLVLSGTTLYGTTYAGGQGGRGTIFSIQANGLGFTVLHQFAPVDAVTGVNADGASPCAPLMLSSNVLYGTAPAGGAGASGTVFSLNISNAQFSVVHSFAAVAAGGTNTDGASPVAPLLRLGNSLYGTTFCGGPGAAGTVFSIPIPAAPAVITNIVWNPNVGVTIFFFGAPGSTNIIQAASSLTPPVTWQNVSTNVADAGGAWQFTDGNLTNTRFYRSYVQ